MPKLTFEKGRAFESWIVDILRQYFPDVEDTHDTQFYDIQFTHEGQQYIIECKCCSLYHVNKFGYITYRKEQFYNLANKEIELGNDGIVTYINGTFLNNFDAYPFVTPLKTIKDGIKIGQCEDRVHIMFSKLLKGEPLRDWIGKIIGLDPSEISYPEFRNYIKHLYIKE